MSVITELHQEHDQSIWLDSLSRRYFGSGLIDELVAAGVRGMTSNPTIMVDSIASDDAYDADIRSGLDAGMSPVEVYWRLVTEDVSRAAGFFEPIHVSSAGVDGYVSVEVAPDLAFDRAATVEAALELRAAFKAPNILIKIPATDAGIGAIEDTIAAGVSVNVTLIFSLARYEQVLDAYERGLQRLHQRGGDLSRIASVASFFVSRVDTEIDQRLTEALPNDPSAAALRGRAADAQAQLAYEVFARRLQKPAWTELAAKGARPQRLLWASTSRKNPAYDPLIYVTPLVGPMTVNTMPEATIRELLASPPMCRTIEADVHGAHRVADELAERGILLQDVGDLLERRGVELFVKSWQQLRSTMEAKAHRLRAQ